MKVGDLVYNILDEGYLGLGLVVPFERAERKSAGPFCRLDGFAYPMASTLEKVRMAPTSALGPPDTHRAPAPSQPTGEQRA